MPFYYLFIPTWLFSIVCYTLVAKRFGAGEDRPEAEQKLAEYNERIEAHHERLAKQESHESVPDTTMLTKILRATWIVIGLVIPSILAWRVLFSSPDLYSYYVNRELFYDVAIWCTVIYFVFAYWDLQRARALQSGSPTPTERLQSSATT